MDAVEDIVIVGAGLAGLATALGLYRKGIRSIVLESSDRLRTTGFALTQWTNAFRALDALGVGDVIRRQHMKINGLSATAVPSGVTTARVSLNSQANGVKHEVRCVRRTMLLETLEKELPEGTIRYSSKIVSINESDNLKELHLADGSTLKTKILIGCDGVNSVIAKWLGLSKPAFTGRSAARGFAKFPDGHGHEPEFKQYFGEGFRAGSLPCDYKQMYWFFTWTPSPQDKELENDAVKTKEFIQMKMNHAKVPEEMVTVIEKSKLSSVVSSPLRYRSPFELLWGNIARNNVCVAGDALHPMTPDIGQGGCAALEDGVILARCLSEAIQEKKDGMVGLEKYAGERRWRSFELVATAYLVGRVQQSDGAVMGFLRDKFLSKFMAGLLFTRAEFDCGTL